MLQTIYIQSYQFVFLENFFLHRMLIKIVKKILLLSLEGFSLMKMSNMIGGYLTGEYLVVP